MTFGISHTTLDGRITDCDDVYATMMKSTRSELIGRNLAEFAETNSYSPKAITELVLLTKQPVLVNRIYVRDDGTAISCVTQVCLIWDEAGMPQSTVAIVQSAPAFSAPSRPVPTS